MPKKKSPRRKKVSRILKTKKKKIVFTSATVIFLAFLSFNAGKFVSPKKNFLKANPAPTQKTTNKKVIDDNIEIIKTKNQSTKSQSKISDIKPITSKTIHDPEVVIEDMATFYRNHSGYNPTGNFAAYITYPLNGTLYVGLGTALPAERDGAILASLNQDNTLEFLGKLNEQGVSDIAHEGDTLFIAGADPCCPDNWAYGNIYTYTPTNGLTKYRNMPNVVHTIGQWVNGDKIYASTGSYTNEIMHGQIFSGSYSDTEGITWNNASDLSTYRVYDVIGLGNRLYAISFDTCYGSECDSDRELSYAYPEDHYYYGWKNYYFMKKSTDGGLTWTDFGQPHPAIRPRMISFKRSIIGIMYNPNTEYYDSLFEITNYGRQKTYSLNDWVIAPYYNVITNAGNKYLYAITYNNKVIRTHNLKKWEEVASFDEDLASISYQNNNLYISTKGTNAKLYKIDLRSPLIDEGCTNWSCFSPLPRTTR